MKMQGVSWKGRHFVFGYEQEAASEPTPDYREIIICQMDDRIDELKNAMQNFIDRVDRGEVRSKKTYADFKALLQEQS